LRYDENSIIAALDDKLDMPPNDEPAAAPKT
jgi:hypothetical protein